MEEKVMVMVEFLAHRKHQRKKWKVLLLVEMDKYPGVAVGGNGMSRKSGMV